MTGPAGRRPRRKVREMAAVVAGVRQETHDTASLFLDIGGEPRERMQAFLDRKR